MTPITITTVEDRAFSLLRTEIVHGTLAPGAPLRLESISRRLGVSTTPVRAALRRLESEGLVRSVPHRGASVAPIDIEDLAEIQAVRAALEGYASRVGAERVSERDIAQMEKAFERLSSIAAADPDLNEYLPYQWRLHDICYAAGHRGRLLDLIAHYRLQAERYIRLAIGSPDGLPGSVELQRRLLDACRARDGLRAEREVQDGLLWTVDRLSKFLENRASA